MENRTHVLNAKRLGVNVIPYLILEYMHYYNTPISTKTPKGISYIGISKELFIHSVFKILVPGKHVKYNSDKQHVELTSKTKNKLDKYINCEKDTKSWFENMFWKEYPNKKGKALAEKAFFKLPFNDNSNLIQDILDGIERRKKWVETAPKDTFIPEWPMPQTYLNGERWKDEYEIHKQSSSDKKNSESIKFKQYQKEEL